MDNSRRLKRIISILEATYGAAEPDNADDPVDCLVRTILSQNTNDTNRDRAFDSLKERFGSWEKVSRADPRRIASAIRMGGLANIKSKRIKHILCSIEAERGRIELDFLKELSPEEVERKLLSYPGVGLKTVRCIQLFALRQQAFPVDTHVHRLAIRMGLISERTSRDQAHKLLARKVPGHKMYSFHINLIRHGRRICTSKGPKCEQCPLNRLCLRIL